MKILATNWNLDIWAGSQTWLATVVAALRTMGHDVDVWSPNPGKVSTALGGISTGGVYDLAITAHVETLNHVRRGDFNCTRIVHVIHGPSDPREKPAPGADVYVAVSPESARVPADLGYKIETVAQPIDCEYFAVADPPREKLECVGLLSHYPDGEPIVQDACRRIGVAFERLGGRITQSDIRDWVASCDLVVGVGRSALEAAAMGRPVVVFDHRTYGKATGDGLLTPGIYQRSARANFSGRGIGSVTDAETLAKQFRRYDPAEARAMRELIESNHNPADIARQLLKVGEWATA